MNSAEPQCDHFVAVDSRESPQRTNVKYTNMPGLFTLRQWFGGSEHQSEKVARETRGYERRLPFRQEPELVRRQISETSKG